METKTKTTMFGEKVDMAKAIKGPPPIVFAVQPEAYVMVQTPEELALWENDVLTSLGVHAADPKTIEGLATSARRACYTYSCSSCCRDDCDQVLY